MEKIKTVGLDLAKTVFQVHAIDGAGVPICEIAPNSDPTPKPSKRLIFICNSRIRSDAFRVQA